MDPVEDIPSTPTEPTKQLPARTLIQGAVVSGLIAVITVLQAAIADGVDKVNWSVTASAVLTAAGMAVASYIMARVKPPV